MKRMVCLGLVAILCLALIPFSAMAEETIKVGVIMDLTGPNSEWGSAQAWGVEHACEEYNANGGINGYMLEPIVMDCASDAQTAVTAYRQLVDEYEVNVIIGPAISNNVIPMAPLAEEDQICVVGHFQDDRCTANEETGETWKYMFLTQPSSSQQGKLLADYDGEGFTRITNEELLELPVDVLVPAALENQITEKNAPNVRAKYIVEGANGPLTPEADEILDKMGVVVVPDILANAGGVVVSYFEWVQNLQSFRWEEDYVNDMLERTMVHAFDEVWEIAHEKGASLRMGAYISALKRVVGAKKLRGIFP